MARHFVRSAIAVFESLLESLLFAREAMPTLWLGALTTLQITAFSVAFGLVGGILLGIARLSPLVPLRILTRIYIDFFRGTPLLVQIFMIYFGIPALVSSLGGTFSFNRFVAAILALGLNSAAYLAEIVRGGIQSIDMGQREAAECLGLDPVQSMRYVIFPQAFRRMIPPLGNEFITLLKDTSLVAVIGYEELFRRGQLIVAQSYRAFEIYITVALMYLLLNTLFSQAFIWLERWMDPTHKAKRRATSAVTNG
jgi:glutamine transport system permease protein